MRLYRSTISRNSLLKIALAQWQNLLRNDLDLKRFTPRPGLEPGSKAPQASRMSTTPPGRVYCLPYLNHSYRLNNSLFTAGLAISGTEYESKGTIKKRVGLLSIFLVFRFPGIYRAFDCRRHGCCDCVAAFIHIGTLSKFC